MFQSREFEGGVLEEEMSETEADVEACRQREGVKKEDGVVGRLLLFDKEGRDGADCRARDDTCRFDAKACEVRSPGANVELEAREPSSSIWRGVRIFLASYLIIANLVKPVWKSEAPNIS